MRRLLSIVLLVFIACKQTSEIKQKSEEVKISYLDTIIADSSLYKKEVRIDSKLFADLLYSKEDLEQFADSSFVLLRKIDTTFLYSMKYATTDNFLKEKVYDCDDCLLRYKTAKQLVVANNEFKKQGYRILFFDCYRPLDVQKKMWKIFPDKRYVANPAKGSNHNRGTAVDITLVNKKGDTLSMGTPFDYFGKKAHHAYQGLPKETLENRKLLKRIMEKNEFWPITSEWWHYNLNKSYNYSVSNFQADCN